jgi:putative transposase
VRRSPRATASTARAARFLDLREAGETCSKHRVARLMRQGNLRALHGYRTRRWDVGKPSVLIPNLLKRRFTAAKPNAAWVTDIAYIRTWQGWLYLAVVMDLFSRLIVGWAAQPTIHRELVLNAVLMAVRRGLPRGTLIHSDLGTQFGSDAWRRFCGSNHLEPSMSRKGNCWENAVAESFFSSINKERIKKQIYTHRELAITEVAHYIDTFYNRTRRHSHLGGLSPEQFEAAHKNAPAASPLNPGNSKSVRLTHAESLPASVLHLRLPVDDNRWGDQERMRVPYPPDDPCDRVAIDPLPFESVRATGTVVCCSIRRSAASCSGSSKS